MKSGHQIIEEALKVALKAEPVNAPFGMVGEVAVAYQMGMAAAYQHALEMIPEPD